MNKKKHLRGEGEFSYDDKYDIFMFKLKDRNYKKSVEFQNFVADLDEEGFVTGIRIFDASKVFDVEKSVLRNIVRGEFKASIENDIITVMLKFVSEVKNKKENFTQQITAPTRSHLLDSSVECAMVAA